MRRGVVARGLVVAACLVAAAAVLHGRSKAERVPSRAVLSQLPARLGAWDGRPGEDLDRETLAVLGVDDFVNRVYTAPGQPPVALYIGYYRSQREGDTIHSPLNCLPGAGWEPVSRTRTAVMVPRDASAPRAMDVNRLIIQKGPDREFVLYWYQSHGRSVASEYWGRLLLALDAVRFNRTDGALVRIVVPMAAGESDDGASARAAEGFVQALYPQLGRFVPD